MTQPRIYILRDGIEDGPYSVAQIADLLRQNSITGHSESRLEGEQASMPLSWQPQFSDIRDLSDSPLSARVDDLIDESVDRGSALVPMPSGGFAVRAVGAILAGFVSALVGGAMTWFDPSNGKVLMYVIYAAMMIVQGVLACVFPITSIRRYGRGYGLIELVVEKQNYPQRLFGFSSVCFFLGALAGLGLQGH